MDDTLMLLLLFSSSFFFFFGEGGGKLRYMRNFSLMNDSHNGQLSLSCQIYSMPPSIRSVPVGYLTISNAYDQSHPHEPLMGLATSIKSHNCTLNTKYAFASNYGYQTA